MVEDRLDFETNAKSVDVTKSARKLISWLKKGQAKAAFA